VDPSCTRAIVNTSPLRAVTRTISATAGVGRTPTGRIDALKGTVGKIAPSPAVTARDVPVVDGDGGTAIVVIAKLRWASNVGAGIRYAPGHCRVWRISRPNSST